MPHTYWIVIAAVAALAPPASAADAKLKDAESATHGFDAARHQIVQTYRFPGEGGGPGFEIVQINLPVLSHYSYILVSGKDALVVDPDRDVAFYLDHAKEAGLSIKGVFLTHSHADFVAGHIEIAKAAGCPIHQNAASGAKYPIEGLKDGSTFTIGTAVIEALATPGHTPDGMCGAVYTAASDPAPKVLLTGDTLFVGSVGRPDLLEGTMSAQELASKGYDTWVERLSKLPDATVILPAHGAGSLCGAHLSDDPSSTIGRERASNPYLQHRSRSEFVAAVLSELPQTPQYFGYNAKMNREGPPLVDWDAMPSEVAPDATLADPQMQWIVDLRDAGPYAEGHIRNAVNIALRGRLETWVGIMVPWGAPLYLTGGADDLKEAVRRLHRIGYGAKGIVSTDAWAKADLPIAKNETVRPADLYAEMQKGTAPLVVDVRLPSEWMGLRIGTVVNLPLDRLAELSAKLDPAKPVVTVCNSAYRSSMAVGVLERKGFARATSMAGGSEAWIAAGLPVFSAQSKAGAAPAAKREIRLAERMAPSELKALILDRPGSFDLVDIRPPEQFADWSIPGSQNADAMTVLNDPAWLAGAGPLIVVDRDGTDAMMVAGILSQRTQRPIKALRGGVEAYWRETEMGAAARTAPLPAAAGGTDGGIRAAPAAPAPAPAKRSAGC
ncbi:MAG: MBL fold metallo-hydrolase [Planctomycetes bacterium]|nr:MBL fold metallo-hydrolase [Planctomycetota bacterium]